MTLHEEIVAILKEVGHGLTTKEIAEKVNERGNYHKQDGTAVTPFQIHGRTSNYPKLFTRKGNKVGLVEGEEEILNGILPSEDYNEPAILFERAFNASVERIFSLSDEMIQVLRDNQDELTTKVIADEINRRHEHEKNEDLPTTAGKIFLEAKNNPKIFEVNGDKVGLAEWNEYDASLSDDYRYYTEGLQEKAKQSEKIEELSITKIGVGNFKSYNTSQELKIKPITLLFGPNSSGKSSLIHSLLYLQNAFSTKELDTHYMKISGDSVDLGGFRQLIHKRDFQRSVNYSIDIDLNKGSELFQNSFPETKLVSVNFEIRQPLQQKKRRKVVRVEDERIYYDEIPTEEFVAVGKPRVQKFEILTDGEPLLNIGLKQNLVFRIDYLNNENPLLKRIVEALIILNTTTSEIKQSDWNIIQEGMDSIINELYSSDTLFIPRQLKKGHDSIYDNPKTFSPIGRDTRENDLISSLKLYLPFSLSEIAESVYNELDSQLGNIIYLGPVRSFPARHLAFTNNNDPNWVAGGAIAWEILRDNKAVREKVNGWLGETSKLDTKYKLEVRKHIDPKSKDFEEQVLAAAQDIDFDLSELNEWIGDSGVVEKILDKVNEEGIIEGINDLVLIDQNSNTVVTHRDVGFGISQVIPVLVSAYANKGKTILIEQPEIHLHPALQAELGDVIIESALGENKNNLILENHSEHLMLRILRRIRENSEGNAPNNLPKITPDDVQVIYIKPSKEGSILFDIPIANDGDFAIRWPDGFFPERAEELF